MITCVCVFSHSVMSNSATPWTVAHLAPLSMGFSRQEYFTYRTLKSLPQKLLKLINEFSKVMDTRIQNILHVYALIMKYQKEKVKKITFKITIKNYLGTNLAKEVKDLYFEKL